jgi:hypothetical protein
VRYFQEEQAVHAELDEEEGGENSPASQGAHADDSSAVAASMRYFPPSHIVQEAEEVPEYLPESHIKHAETLAALVAELYFPATQAVHDEDVGPEYVPAPHEEQEVEEASEKYPALQLEQAEASTGVAEFMRYLPLGHAVQNDEDAAEYIPTLQGEHDTAM